MDRFAGQKEEAARGRSSSEANSGSDEACFDCGGRGIITRGRLRGVLEDPVDDGRDVPRGQNNTPLVSSSPRPATFSLYESSLDSPRSGRHHSGSILLHLSSLSSWVIRSHRQKGLAVRRLRSSSAASIVPPRGLVFRSGM